METIEIKEKLRTLYENSPAEYRVELECIFGENLFKNIQNRIKSYEDACFELGLNPKDLPEVNNCESKDQSSIIAFYKLTIIARALNEGWKPNWKDSSEYKWFPWFKVNRDAAGVGFSYTYSATSLAYAYVGSRLCSKSDELATYFGKQFIDLWNDFFLFR